MGKRRVGVGVLGASGYSGVELVRLLAAHPGAELRAAGSRQFAGVPLGRVWPVFADAQVVLDDDPIDPAVWMDRGVEVVFSALPHGAFAARAAAFLEAGLRAVDLSADFRLRDPLEYERRYGLAHAAPDLLGSAIYGLAEWCDRDALGSARLVANPGCYATAILLAALPAVAAGLWSGAPILVSALSGVSGAGRSPALGTHFVECGTTAAPYKVGEEHQHLGEILQAIAGTCGGVTGGTGGHAPAASNDAPLVFNPHLVPMTRGILADVAVPLARPLERGAAIEIYRERYAGRPFVRILGADALPETRHVLGSNRADLAVRTACSGSLLLVFAAIDNLGKGAAGQAVQNWNVMSGWPESTGLARDGWPCA
jgi:N-acetyl-gamma-glutamyl-phosphate reductase